ncbi:MAG: hypothetical protein JRD47_07790 [Deltaproteobacteria bacterium]|jgi:hypothetical protein|nr:hypothetical protein [Deltaproteobacteria bacterium]MBW2266041.1 hypothetical protein [Deltaproteobacteria bacterium]MBW2601810.1 hypothetical protein [Deltaproteobacteria bacterium]
MFPFAFEWINDPSHFVFMGGFYFALGGLFIAVNYCVMRALFDWLCKGGENHNEH